MRTFLVNLERRPDRLAVMTAQLDRLGIAFERFDAVDAERVDSARLDRPFADTGLLGLISRGSKACTCSHLELWRRIAQDSDDYATILEDDIVLTEAAPAFLHDSAWIPEQIDLIKLERYGDANQLVVVGNRRLPVLGRELVPLVSRHTGSGGYIISRRAAAMLASMTEKLTVPIDHLLFNPGKSPVFARLKPWQLLPAILDQQEATGGASDILRTRAAAPKGVDSLKRALLRNYYDLRLVPRQILAVIVGRARIVKIPVV